MKSVKSVKGVPAGYEGLYREVVDQPMVMLDNLQDAIVGQWNGRVVYSENLILEILQDDMDPEDAQEWLDYNIYGLVDGMEYGPIIVSPLLFE